MTMTARHAEALWRLRNQLQGGAACRDDFERFLAAAYAVMPLDFPWTAWEKAALYDASPSLLADAPMEDCLRMLTVCVRRDRLEPGALREAAGSDRLGALLSRLIRLRHDV